MKVSRGACVERKIVNLSSALPMIQLPDETELIVGADGLELVAPVSRRRFCDGRQRAGGAPALPKRSLTQQSWGTFVRNVG